jgi:hypothetical protein
MAPNERALPGDAVQAALARLRSIDGLTTACLVEPNSAHVIDTLIIDPPVVDTLTVGDGDPSPADGAASAFVVAGTVAAGASDVVQVVELMTSSLGAAEQLEEVIITLGRHHHLITPLPQAGADGLLIVLTLDRSRTNLALARQQLRALGPLLGAPGGPGSPGSAGSAGSADPRRGS